MPTDDEISKEEQQLRLFDIPPDWVDKWQGMPDYDHQDLQSWRQLIVHFRNQEDQKKFSELVGQTVTNRTRSIWYPQAEIGRYADKRYITNKNINPRYPVYIISKGRWETRKTSKALEEIGVPYNIVIEPQEADQYASVIDPEKILLLPFSNLGQGSIPARNWVWEHSISRGFDRHWILDDNIEGFYRFQKNLKTPVGDGAVFRAAEDFTERFENVALSGFNYFMFVTRKSGRIPPFTLNTRIYSCILIRNDIPFRWRGRYNEDTDLSIRVLKAGWCTILFNAFLAGKSQTMTMKGGNTDELYQGDGRLKMAESLQEQHPDVVQITEKWGRPQHHVNYKIFRFNQLKPKPGVDISAGDVNNYGMELEFLQKDSFSLDNANEFRIITEPKGNAQMPQYFTDRSRQVAFQKCPRARFWSTEYGAWGLSPAAPDLDMELGKALHTGIASLLSGKSIDEAIFAAALSIDTAFEGHFPQSIDTHYQDLCQGLLRAFALAWLPKIQTKYTILAVEEEITAPLSADIQQMARPDAILGDKVTGEIGVWSIKSTSRWDDLRELESRVDTQGLSEAWAVEAGARLGQEDIKVSWVQMFVILTGDKEETPEGRIHNSPVNTGWFRETGLGPPELAHSYWWKDAEGKRRGLGKGWTRFSPAESYEGGIAGWVADLAARKIQPDLPEPISGLFHLPPAHYRNPADIEAWKQQTFFQEDEVRVAAIAWNDPNAADDYREFILNRYFPQHRQSCVYLRRRCAFFQLCHGTASEAEDPLANGFKWREVNHPQERGETT